MGKGQPGSQSCCEPESSDRSGQVPSNAMAGSLIGCWYTDTFKLVTITPHGVIHATGSEHYVGCLDTGPQQDCTNADPAGTLALTYRFEAKLDPVTGDEIWGRRQHQIVSGTGGFAGAAGRIDFKDNDTNGTSTYQGHIILPDRQRAARATASVAATRSSRCAEQPGCRESAPTTPGGPIIISPPSAAHDADASSATTHILLGLGARSRGEVIAEALRLGLAPPRRVPAAPKVGGPPDVGGASRT